MKIEALKKTYESRRVLDFPGFELKKGEICAVIGSNGSGKSTLAKIAAGAVAADKGAKPFGEKLNIGYMPQKSYAFRMSALRNLCLCGGDRDKATEMLKKLGLESLAKSPAKKLSGGETARMALGRVLMESHELIILDEPTASMDMESTAVCEELIRAYCREHNAAALWVTHSLAQAKRVADKVLFLKRGCLVEWGETSEMLSNPKESETAEFLRFYQ